MQYTNVLDGRAYDIQAYNGVETEETHNLRREVLRLSRESYASDTDTAYQSRDLLARLSACAECAKTLGRFHDGLMLRFEAVALARENLLKSRTATPENSGDGNADQDWRLYFFAQSVESAKMQEAAGHVRSARASARELLTQIESGELDYPGNNSRVVPSRLLIAQGLFETTELLAGSDDLVIDLPAAQRTIEHAERLRREIGTTDYIRKSERQRPAALFQLENTFALHAKILHKLGKDNRGVHNEASILQAELVESLKKEQENPYSAREKRILVEDAARDLELYLQGVVEEDGSTRNASKILATARGEAGLGGEGKNDQRASV